MPIYEYHCDHCGTTFEKMQRITEPPADTCDACGKGPVHKLISQSTFHLKGSGWYVTDYGKGSGGKGGAHKRDSKPSTSSSGDSSKD